MKDKNQPLVRLKKISKSFGKVNANKNINLYIHAGKIKALLGENGAGKSTLMRILAGRMRPDSGEIFIDGNPVAFNSSKDAIKAGIGMVYQHFTLVGAMTVYENVFLGQEGGFWLSPGRMIKKVAELGKKYHLEIDPEAKISSLSMGERQRVEILKLLMRQTRILIFDEPTAVLTPGETERLFSAMRRMAQSGKAIVFISHKLGEVMSVAHEIAILRKGEIVDAVDASEVKSRKELARRMVGKEVLLEVKKEPVAKGGEVLSINGLTSGSLKNISLDVRKGEILAVVGVAGNGQKPLVETVCGLLPPKGGHVEILKKQWKDFFSLYPSPSTLSYIPEDRLGLATCPGLDLCDNFLLTTRGEFSKGPWLRGKLARDKAQALVKDFRVMPGDTKILARQLSGGNLQKMVLGREFYRNPGLIVAEQPTQGLDIAATEEVWNYLLDARKNAGILLVTGDLTEALALADKIAVMFGGRITDIFDASDKAKIDKIGLMMAGIMI